jgi:hypothetical protein
MNRISATPEGRIALQRQKNGQDLTPQQAAIVKKYNALEFSHNEQARREQYSGGWMSSARPHTIPQALYDIEAIGDTRQRVHAIRTLRAQWRDDRNSDFNNVNSPEHQNAVSAMERLYLHEAELGTQPEDGE